MGGDQGTNETHALTGPIDRAALITIRDVITEQEPLATAELDDFLDPRVLTVSFDDGLCGADSARIDVQWTTNDDYKFHYTDSDGVESSCSGHTRPHLVTRAVLKLWRRAYHADSLAPLNAGRDPP